MFNEAKTAQAAAYLLYKAGGKMEHLKLMKLLYLADRLSWQERDYSISGDDYYSLPYGPVLSNTLNLMRGESITLYNGSQSEWMKWIADKENHTVSIVKEFDEADEYFFDCLSKSDEEILDKIFVEFGHFKTFALVNYTHDSRYIPEWEDPNGSSKQITLSHLLSCLGKTSEQINAIFEDQAIYQDFDNAINGKA